MHYEATFKLKVINFAKEMNNSSATREFSVNEKQVREWQKAKVMLSEMPKIKCTTMTECVNQQRSSGFIVTRPTI